MLEQGVELDHLQGPFYLCPELKLEKDSLWNYIKTSFGLLYYYQYNTDFMGLLFSIIPKQICMIALSAIAWYFLVTIKIFTTTYIYVAQSILFKAILLFVSNWHHLANSIRALFGMEHILEGESLYHYWKKPTWVCQGNQCAALTSGLWLEVLLSWISNNNERKYSHPFCILNLSHDLNFHTVAMVLHWKVWKMRIETDHRAKYLSLWMLRFGNLMAHN